MADIATWFNSCKDNKTLSTVREMLAAGFDPDTKDPLGANGLWYAAEGSKQGHSEQVADVLIDALKRKYKDDPKALIAALTNGQRGSDISAHFHDDHASVKTKISSTVQTAKQQIRRSKIDDLDPAIFFESCHKNELANDVREYLRRGFDPDTRDSSSKSGLWHAAEGSQQGHTAEVASLLIDGLKKKYQDDPHALIKAINDGANGITPHDRFHQDHGDTKTKIQQTIAGAKAQIRKGKIDQLDPAIWFESCHKNDHADDVRVYLKRGFDPDTRDGAGKSGLWHAAEGSTNGNTQQIADQLIDALKKKHQNEPEELIKALNDGAGGQTPHDKFHQDHGDIKTKIQQAIGGAKAQIRKAKIIQQDPAIWFESCRKDDYLADVKEYLKNGFDVDARDSAGKSGLWYAAEGSQNSNTKQIADVLIDALKKKYQGDPASLIKALEDSPNGTKPADRFHQDHSDISTKIRQNIAQAKQQLGGNNQGVPVPVKPAATTKAVVAPVLPRSDAPPPIKLDRTLTPAKLLQAKESGKTNMQILAEQGQLGDVFSDGVWSGRREEMDQAWESVPEQFRNQVNIEVVRGKLSQATLRDRFKIDKSKGWEQGF